jgi:cell division protein FtsB
MILPKGPLIVIHAAVATVIILLLGLQVVLRDREVERNRQEARSRSEDTARLRQEIARLENLSEGLHHKDPYVIELVTRDLLHYSRPGEIAAPPVVDKAAASTTK